MYTSSVRFVQLLTLASFIIMTVAAFLLYIGGSTGKLENMVVALKFTMLVYISTVYLLVNVAHGALLKKKPDSIFPAFATFACFLVFIFTDLSILFNLQKFNPGFIKVIGIVNLLAIGSGFFSYFMLINEKSKFAILKNVGFFTTVISIVMLIVLFIFSDDSRMNNGQLFTMAYFCTILHSIVFFSSLMLEFALPVIKKED